MERYIQKIKSGALVKTLFMLIFLTGMISPLFSQTPSVIRNIRLPLWAELDAYPGLELSEEDGEEPAPRSESEDD